MKTLIPKPMLVFWAVILSVLYVSFLIIIINRPNESIFAKIGFPLIIDVIFAIIPFLNWQEIRIINDNEFYFFRITKGTTNISPLELTQLYVGPGVAFYMGINIKSSLALKASFTNGTDINLEYMNWGKKRINEFADYLIKNGKGKIQDKRQMEGIKKA